MLWGFQVIVRTAGRAIWVSDLGYKNFCSTHLIADRAVWNKAIGLAMNAVYSKATQTAMLSLGSN